MNGSEALRVFERKLIPARTIAGTNQALERYMGDELPPMSGRDSVLVEQSFHAGYDAAMAQTRRILAEVQTEALREARM